MRIHVKYLEVCQRSSVVRIDDLSIVFHESPAMVKDGKRALPRFAK